MEDTKLDKQALDLLYSKKLISYADYLKLIHKDDTALLKWAGINFVFLSAALMLAGVVCFFAYNWAHMGKILKLLLPFCAFGALAGAAVYKGLDGMSGKVLSLCACVFIGIFLAVYGQVYQTGADAWQLFLGWTVLMLPLVILTRFTGLWIFFAVILNVFLFAYPFEGLISFPVFMLLLTLVNGAFYAAGEWLSPKIGYLKEAYFKGIFYFAALCCLFAASYYYIYNGRGAAVFILFWFFTAGFVYYMLKNKNGITYIGLNAAAAATVLLFIFIKTVMDSSFGRDMFLVTAFVSIVLYGAAAFGVFEAHKYIKGDK